MEHLDWPLWKHQPKTLKVGTVAYQAAFTFKYLRCTLRKKSTDNLELGSINRRESTGVLI